MLAAFLAIGYFLLPDLKEAGKSLGLLERINVGFLGLAIVLEGASILAYAHLTRSVLPGRRRLGVMKVLRVNLSTLAVSHVVPGGTIGGVALNYRLLRRCGVAGADAGFALALQGIGSAVVLNILLWLSLVISIPVRGFDPLYLTAAIVGSLLVGAFLAVVTLLTCREGWVVTWLRAIARKLPFVDESAVARSVPPMAERLRVVVSNRSLLVRALAWSSARWLLDAASLGVFIAAFGFRVSPDVLFVAFGLANVLAAIPVTPGGLGVVEAVLIPTLAGFGTPKPIAVLGVLAYRVINFWLPIPLGAVAYASLDGERASGKRVAEEPSMASPVRVDGVLEPARP